MEELTLLSYNIYFGRKLHAIADWIRRREKTDGTFDIICFQEFPYDQLTRFMSNRPKNSDYRFTPSIFIKKRRFGHLTIWRKNKLHLIQDTELFLGDSRIEKKVSQLLRRSTKRHSLLTLFQTSSHDNLMVANTHLTAIALNGHRISQLRTICQEVTSYRHVLIVGDLNYTSALPRFSLRRLIKKYHFEDATKKIKTHRLLLMKHQLDYIFSRGVMVKRTAVKQLPFSDHYPLMASLRIEHTS